MPDKPTTFFTTFVTLGFIFKIVSEFLHEVCGHGFFVLLFGGKITGVHISLLWPYEFSRISWSFTGDVSLTQLAWIYVGGILVCLLASFMTQTFLFCKKKVQWHLAIVLFWLAFWTLVNSTGYLIIGGLAPFGDVEELIGLGVLTRQSSLLIGLLFFALGFILLSWVLRKLFVEIYPLRKASFGVSLFWLIIPLLVTVMMLSPERSLAWSYLPLSFIPALLSIALEYLLFLSK
ncbi:hypothetical protein CW707_01680 [Candidatus Bathyarchaeota archaeon]|nr:MAG: hypothetical protein CW707_01680 [Candidatus Bathyarchaeota archaeon]